MFTFTPLLGAHSESQAVQSLLEFDGGIKILIDVGWDTKFSAESLKELERQVPTISLVLLTHATISHVGAYAHCCKNIPLFNRIPVFATTPVISLGRTLLQDLYNSTPLASSLLPASALGESAFSFAPLDSTDLPNILLPPPSNDDIASYFSIINDLKYSQPRNPQGSPFTPPLDGLTITAYGSGHTLGGTIWHIQHASESVVYAVDWNQARENILSGAAWLGGAGATGAEVIEQLKKPTALICSSKGAEDDAVAGGWKKRDDLLLHQIRSAVERGSSVLIPCDSSARCLELSYLLERAWMNDKLLQSAKLYMASRTCASTMRYARSMLEWMDESIIREFEVANTQANSNQAREGPGAEPFNFKHLRLIERSTQLSRALSTHGSKVFLASDPSLEWGFSRDIMRDLCSDVNNLLVLTDHLSQTPDAGQDTLSTALSNLALSKQASDGFVQCGDDQVDFKSCVTSTLTAKDLPIYQQWLQRQRQRQNAAPNDQATTLETSADVVDDASSSSSSEEEESDNEHQGKVLNVSTALTHSKHKLGLTDEELGINVLLRRKNVHDYDVRGKRGREKMFPFVAKRRRHDEFGEIIRPEEYLRAEEKEDVNGQDQGNVADDNAVGQKRRWDAGKTGRGNVRSDIANKKRRNDGSVDQHRDPQQKDDKRQGSPSPNDDESDEESDYEPAEPTVSGPTRVSITAETIRVSLRLASIDFSSIHDKRSLQMLIPLIAPRKLILTGGRAAETRYLAAECRRMLGNKDVGEADVFAPANGETVDASVDTNAWTIKLSQSLYRQLNWQKVRNLGIVTINGRVKPQKLDNDLEESNVKRQKVEEESDTANKNVEVVQPTLDVLPSSLAATTRAVAQSLHVGDLRLAELRRILQAAGHLAEFKGEGILLVDGLVAVRKTGVGRIIVESGGLSVHSARARQLSASFSNVKRRIYEGLAVVTAR